MWLSLAPHRYLYFTGDKLRCLRKSPSGLRLEVTFDADEEGITNFSEYIRQHRDSLWHFVADVTEEDYVKESIPYLHGKDRTAILKRKTAQRYRDQTLVLIDSLGTTFGTRKEEQILLSSFTNTQQFQPWLHVMQTFEARVAGFFSTAFSAPWLINKLSPNVSHCILVSINSAGLRQSYLSNGKLRFSRLVKLGSDITQEIGRRCRDETARLHQYLLSSRLLPKDTERIDVFVVVPTNVIPDVEATCLSNIHMSFRIMDIAEGCRRCGLSTGGPDSLSEGMYLQALARSVRPPRQYASGALRRFYRLWCIRNALLAGGAVAFAVLFSVSAMLFYRSMDVAENAVLVKAKAVIVWAQYAQLQAAFPKTPIPAAQLRTLNQNFQTIEKSSANARDLLNPLSNALREAPQVEIDRIEWRTSNNPKFGISKNDGNRPDTAATTVIPQAPLSDMFQVAEISGRISVAQASDYRAITAIAEQFATALQKNPGLQIIALRLPFEITAEKALQGIVGAERVSSAPEFAVTLARLINARGSMRTTSVER